MQKNTATPANTGATGFIAQTIQNVYERVYYETLFL